MRAILRSGALLLAVLAVGVAPALAEKADRNKPVNIESDRMNADDVKKTAVFDGRVVLTQGTLTIRADRITVQQDKDGFKFGTAIGGPASFRQKRDGVNEYVEAEAERIEYDAKAERVEFFEKARMRRDSGDDVRGNYISYDARTEFFTVGARRDGAARDASKPQERVRATIQPRNSTEPAGGDAKPAAGGAPTRTSPSTQ